jgi:C4-dicarboxylate-specific signal transduction histidine kinase
MGPVDMNTIVRTAVKLSQPQWKTQNVELRTVLQPELPSVLGDSSQLLQICVQLLNSAIHALSRQGRSVLMITVEHKDGVVTIHIFDLDGPLATAESHAAPSESGVTKPTQPISGLDLSACQGILQQHRGRLSWQQDGSSATSIRVELPVMAPAARKSSAPTGSPAWEPRPSA